MKGKNLEVIFQEDLINLVESFGLENQDGVKEALRQCQKFFACVSKNHQKNIAEAFEVEPKMIKTIIKFMPSIKESIVDYDVVCCTGSRCAKNGSVEVIKAVKASLGIDFNETTEDGRISLTSQNCFKKCGLGPNIMINGRLYHQVDKNKARELMDSIKK